MSKAKNAPPAIEPAVPDQWKIRIKRTADVDPRTIAAHPLNHRIHSEYQKRAMTGAFQQLGWTEYLIINEVTGRLLNGHMRVALAIRDKQKTVPVAYVELTPSEEAASLATHDAIGALADIDFDNLSENLSHVTSATNADLASFFEDLKTQSEMFRLGAGEARNPKTRTGEDKNKQIKAVLYTDEVGIFEEAIKATGKRNRGEALIDVCRGYLEHAATR